jgi:hypothetical protein
MMTNGDAPPGEQRRVSALAVAAWAVVTFSALVLLWEFFTWANNAEDACNLQPDLGGRDGLPGSSWWPPGPTCSYQVQSSRADGTPLTLTVGASPFIWTTALLVITCVALLFALRRARRAR